jgi:hypothetical protein
MLQNAIFFLNFKEMWGSYSERWCFRFSRGACSSERVRVPVPHVPVKLVWAQAGKLTNYSKSNTYVLPRPRLAGTHGNTSVSEDRTTLCSAAADSRYISTAPSFSGVSRRTQFLCWDRTIQLFMGKGKNMSNYTCWSMEVSTVHKSQILLCRKVCKSGWVLLNIGAIKGAGWKAGRPSIHPPAAWSSAATWPNPGRAAHDLGDVAARLCGLNPRDAAETFSGTDAGLSNSSLAHSAGLVNDPSVARWTLVLSAIQLGGHAWGCGSNKQIPIDRPSDRRGT